MKNLGFDRKGLVNKCPNCKAEISYGYNFCYSCGYKFIKTDQSSQTKIKKKGERTYHDHTSSIPPLSQLITKPKAPNSTNTGPQIKVREFKSAPIEKKEQLKVISYGVPVNPINSEVKQGILSGTNSRKSGMKIRESLLAQLSESPLAERIHDSPGGSQPFSTNYEKTQEHIKDPDNHLEPDHMKSPLEILSQKPIIDSVPDEEIVPISIPALSEEKKKEVKAKPTYYFCSFCGMKSRKKPKFCIQCGTIVKNSFGNTST